MAHQSLRKGSEGEGARWANISAHLNTIKLELVNAQQMFLVAQQSKDLKFWGGHEMLKASTGAVAVCITGMALVLLRRIYASKERNSSRLVSVACGYGYCDRARKRCV